MAKVQELNNKITKASLFVQATSSIQRFVFPLLSKDGQSSGFTKSKSLMTIEREVSKLENKAEQ